MSGEPTVQKGDSGDWVTHLQDLMRDAGFWQEYANGNFDDDLEQAVQAMQDDLGLQQTGVVDEDTWSALEQRTGSNQGSEQADTTTDTASGTSDGSTASQDSAPAEYDADAWNTFLLQNGAAWNGDDAAWDHFRTWFAYEAGQQGLADPAAGFLTYVEGQPDKRTAFAAYGVDIAAPADAGDSTDPQASQASDPSTFPETKLGDSGEWVAYLDATLTSMGF